MDQQQLNESMKVIANKVETLTEQFKHGFDKVYEMLNAIESQTRNLQIQISNNKESLSTEKGRNDIRNETYSAKLNELSNEIERLKQDLANAKEDLQELKSQASNQKKSLENLDLIKIGIIVGAAVKLVEKFL